MKRTFAMFFMAVPLWASAGTISIRCIGPESDNCPIAIDATLSQERLTTQFLLRTPSGGFAANVLAWCGADGSGVGQWVTGGGCVTSGKFRVLNGELTKQQLADGSIQFEMHAPMAFCGNGSGYAECNLVTR